MYYEVLSLVLEKEKKILCLLCNKRRTKKNLSTETEGRGE